MGERFEGLSRAIAEPTSRRGILKVFGAALATAGVAVLVKPFRSADAATTCPSGAAKCGQGCCQRGESCSIPGGVCCCPSGTTPCGPSCCRSGIACLNYSKGTCGCPSNTTPCKGNTCCPQGTACGGQDCPNADTFDVQVPAVCSSSSSSSSTTSTTTCKPGGAGCGASSECCSDICVSGQCSSGT